MPRRRTLARFGFLPDAVRDALRRRMREMVGTGLILVAVLLALALATWSVADPSLSHATNAPVRNVLGIGGAIIADLLTQLLGLAALMLVLPIGIWGWRLASHRRLGRERIRLWRDRGLDRVPSACRRKFAGHRARHCDAGRRRGSVPLFRRGRRPRAASAKTEGQCARGGRGRRTSLHFNRLDRAWISQPQSTPSPTARRQTQCTGHPITGCNAGGAPGRTAIRRCLGGFAATADQSGQ